MKTAAGRWEEKPAAPGASLRVIALVASLGCDQGGAPPVIAGVSPARAHSDVAVTLKVDAPSLRPGLFVDVTKQAVTFDDNTVHVSLVPAVADGRPTVALGPTRWLRHESFLATIPAAIAPGIYDVRLEAPNGKTAALSAAFEELGPDLTPPALTVTAPRDGDTLAAGIGHTASILADDLDGELAEVRWETSDAVTGACDVRPLPDTNARPSRISCTLTFPTPTLSDAELDVPYAFRVTARDIAGQTTTVEVPLSLGHVPEVADFSQAIGSLGGHQPFVVHGRFFAPGSRAFIGGMPIAGALPGGDRIDDTTIVGLTPPHDRAEALAVEIRAPAGVVFASGSFRYVAPPRIRLVFPPTGPTTGGIRITIAGNDLRMGVSISFGATLDVAQPLLAATYDADAKVVGCLPPGQGTVSLWARDAITGDGTLMDAFTYTPPASPVPAAPDPACADAAALASVKAARP